MALLCNDEATQLNREWRFGHHHLYFALILIELGLFKANSNPANPVISSTPQPQRIGISAQMNIFTNPCFHIEYLSDAGVNNWPYRGMQGEFENLGNGIVIHLCCSSPWSSSSETMKNSNAWDEKGPHRPVSKSGDWINFRLASNNRSAAFLTTNDYQIETGEAECQRMAGWGEVAVR